MNSELPAADCRLTAGPTMWSSRRSGIVFLLLLVLYLGAIAAGAQLIQVSDPEQADAQLPLWRYLAQELGR